MDVSSVARRLGSVLAAVTFGILPWCAAEAHDPTSAQADHFENVVRPLLQARCVSCHGSDTQWGELRLDRRAGFAAGGEHGPLVVAGDPEASRLIAAVRREGDLAMPPDDPLPPAEVAVLEAWVADGAPWPNDQLPISDPSAARETHWAFAELTAPGLPDLSHIPWAADWARTPVDAFIAEALAAKELTPASEADRRTLIRRLSYDLTGLPPSPEEVAAFEADTSPDAYEQLVERLLASPHYGEAQARRWLDLARYADTKGYVYAREHRVWVHAATYRDWVVEAFNDDLPYDRFLTLQLAADQAAPDDPAAQAAMGFLTLGRRFLGVTHDIIDDRIDTVTRTTMGLTVACARCHDHKYDPIPTDDYYALYGVFASCTEELLRVGPTPTPAAPSDDEVAAFEASLAQRQQKLAETIATRRHEAADRARARISDYLIAQTELEKYPAEGFDTILGEDDIIPAFVRQLERILHEPQLAHDPVFAAWVALAANDNASSTTPPAADRFAFRAASVLEELAASGVRVNGLVAAIVEPAPASMRELAQRYGQLLADVDDQWQAAIQAANDAGVPQPKRLASEELEELRAFLYGPQALCRIPDEPIVSIEGFFPSSVCEELWKLQGEIDRWIIEQPASPAYTLRLVDRSELRTPWVFRRGDPKQPIRRVPRRFLSLIDGEEARGFADSGGRLEMAEAIVAPTNPLTPRVWANRLWQQHVGRGLVDTPSDFGTRAPPPSHPALLDWLASELIESGWSTKHLHRLIVCSAAYRQRSDAACNEQTARHAREVDPSNRLLWRMNARRLSFEAYRDTLLAVSGRLDPAMGGRASDMLAGDGLSNRRRSLYGTIDRQFLPTVLRVFDMANPDLHVPNRSETTVPQQALFALNHPFVAEHARGLAARAQAEPLADDAAVRALYRTALQRAPTADQLTQAVTFLNTQEAATERIPPESTAWHYGYGPVDPETGTLGSFTPLPHFTGDAWQGGPAWPDATLGWVQITAEGGHTGNDLAHSSVRRWIAPEQGTFHVTSEVIHEEAAGDGIRCHLLVRGERVATAVVHNSRVKLSVEAVELSAGDTIDFVADVRDTLNSDQHLWAAEVSEVPATASDAAPRTWDAASDFFGPQPAKLSRFEQLAQILLISNETMFVD